MRARVGIRNEIQTSVSKIRHEYLSTHIRAADAVRETRYYITAVRSAAVCVVARTRICRDNYFFKKEN